VQPSDDTLYEVAIDKIWETHFWKPSQLVRDCLVGTKMLARSCLRVSLETLISTFRIMIVNHDVISTFKTLIDSNILFELNENDPNVIPSGLTDIEFERFMALPPKQKQKDLQDWIKRINWETERSVCFVPSCGKQLGILSGRINCFKCGHQVCLEHSLFQMKLSITAKHDPINGIWARVCVICFKASRQSHCGVSRARTTSFLQIRSIKISQLLMDSNKIEKRLLKVPCRKQD
jgi:hypothetical protein